MEKWRTKSEAEKEIEFNILLFKFPQNFNSQMMHFWQQNYLVITAEKKSENYSQLYSLALFLILVSVKFMEFMENVSFSLYYPVLRHFRLFFINSFIYNVNSLLSGNFI